MNKYLGRLIAIVSIILPTFFAQASRPKKQFDCYPVAEAKTSLNGKVLGFKFIDSIPKIFQYDSNGEGTEGSTQGQIKEGICRYDNVLCRPARIGFRKVVLQPEEVFKLEKYGRLKSSSVSCAGKIGVQDNLKQDVKDQITTAICPPLDFCSETVYYNQSPAMVDDKISVKVQATSDSSPKKGAQ